MKNKTTAIAWLFACFVSITTAHSQQSLSKKASIVPPGLQVQFTNNTGLHDSLVFITIQNPSLGSNSFNVAYLKNDSIAHIPFASSTALMSKSISLADLDSTGMYVDTIISGIFFVSYGAKLESVTAAPSFVGGGTDFHTPFQNFELTRLGNLGDQGDLTAINYFTAPMSIKSYDASGNLLQSKGYVDSTSAILSKLIAITNSNPSAVIKTLDQKTYVRVIGPSSYSATETNPYPSFIPYLNSIQEANDTALIQNHNAFVDTATNANNYDFRLNFKATVLDSTIQLNGSVAVYKTPYGSTTALDKTFQNVSVRIACPDDSIGPLNLVIYGQSIKHNVSFSGWEPIQNYMDSVALSNSSAFNITQSLAIGEVTTGLLLGLIDSDSLSPSLDSLKNMPSQDWWTMVPMKAFSDVQSDSLYYNQYANVIYKASQNEVYSIPYSDRLGSGPLVNSVNYNGSAVSKWIITLDPPLGKVATEGTDSKKKKSKKK